MEVLAYLIPVALFLGMAGLGAFFWALRSGQFEDLDGAGMRILIDDEDALHGNPQVSCPPVVAGEGHAAKENVDAEQEPK